MAQPALSFQRHAGELDAIAELGVTCDHNPLRSHFLATQPEQHVHPAFYLQRERHLHITPAHTDVCSLRAQRHVRALKSNLDLKRNLDPWKSSALLRENHRAVVC